MSIFIILQKNLFLIFLLNMVLEQKFLMTIKEIYFAKLKQLTQNLDLKNKNFQKIFQ
jgi:hypothetical protein